ncbi:HD domain-containing phosphohydrolase [Geobacter sp. AOG2]|uniref:HD domain-containing phosphohydrolase n=1 Tax=Geobacter sp. AOG2 TaxID=1566347 RepID=UPI001CC61F53|nr:HD domain-containing phosphohydrolase [Geobacter sp. AOG2]GFE59647.1 two-component system response regulator [Geobacter sp. AOG2]
MSDTERSIQVLLVDDEENILKSLQRLLMEEEFELHTASSAEQGIATLKELDNVGLIISDQRMPGMNGSEFLQYCREAVPDAPRILLTGYSDISATIDAINKGGAYRYISKPWNDAELIQTIRDAVRQYALLMENRRLNEIVRQQNEELQEWNRNLKGRVLEQTTAIRQKNEELHVLLKRVKEDYDEIIAVFSGLVEMHGGKLRQHSRNVAELSVNAARELGISGNDLETIRIAALLHDIGEIGIPERILALDRDAMNADELKQYQQHPIRGQVAIDTIEGLRAAGLFIRHHHENLDGSGFPDRLAGDEIPLGARIIAFADHIDKASETCRGDIADQALIKSGFVVGTQLDPSLQKVFRKVAPYTYFSMGAEEKELVEVELDPKELKEGMFLSRDVSSASGILLLGRGVALDVTKLAAIRRNYELDAPPHGVFVMVSR